MLSLFHEVPGPAASCFVLPDSVPVDPGHWKPSDDAPMDPLPPWKASFGVSSRGMEERDLVLWSMMWELSSGQERFLHTDTQAAMGDCFDGNAPGETLTWGWAWDNGAMRGYFYPPDKSDYPFPDLPHIRGTSRFEELALCASWEAWIHERAGADRVYLWSWPRGDVDRAMKEMKGERYPRVRDVLGDDGVLQMFQVNKPALILFSNAPLERPLQALETEFKRRVSVAREALKVAETKDEYLDALRGVVGGWYLPPYTDFIV